MKTRKNKLHLNKNTVANLSHDDLRLIKGGHTSRLRGESNCECATGHTDLNCDTLSCDQTGM